MVVPNMCNPDYRVMKQAEGLAQAGYEVRVYCTWKPGIGLPILEEINGVTYVRREWNLIGLLKEKLLGIDRPTDTIRLGERYKDDQEEPE